MNPFNSYFAYCAGFRMGQLRVGNCMWSLQRCVSVCVD
jgi:hypothetical protein